ncbi:penicillin-binding protein 1A [Candidatus Sneabacter namystus]|uniref:peptidoglycan glycosyltransferase n=1 Tax=Candidatus Sneabacter namystus TaxID=2601646 RepID=A0A5C0UI33_9RICK|nr:PBP1A family penicillin-binding protein [Candidatus Sneabacter namystus]QEK39419.1 PBP1A family penicillin-binding protein [Candidatus Sneabacter namystus]
MQMRFKFFSRAVITLFISCVLSVVLVLWHYARCLPDYQQLKEYQPAQTTRIYSSDLRLIEEYGAQKRVFVSVEAIPTRVKEAFIAAEDKNFFQHSGVDFKSTIMAALGAVPRLYVKKIVKGGSTITQQVVKNVLLSSDRTAERKIKEIILALLISQKLSKEQILELYLNHVYFGLGVYGIASAAQHYFDRDVKDLSLSEAAFLAGVLKYPSSCDPNKYYRRAKMRRDYVLDRMHEDGCISCEERQYTKSQDIITRKRDRSGFVMAPYYAEKVREWAIRKFGQDTFYKGGLTIVTSMDSDYQSLAHDSLIQGLRRHDISQGFRGSIGKIDVTNWKDNIKRFENTGSLLTAKIAVILGLEKDIYRVGLVDGSTGRMIDTGPFANHVRSKILKEGEIVVVHAVENDNYTLSQVPELNGAILAMHPISGKILAMVGGYDYEFSKFDRASQARRQIGSLVKTFVYMTALENNIEPNTTFVDEPIVVKCGENQPYWVPRNYERDFRGKMTMRYAFEKSRNTVTVKIADQVGINSIVEMMQRLGIDVHGPQYISLVLGAVEGTLEQVVQGYSRIVNGGAYVDSTFVEYVQDSKGNTIYANGKELMDVDSNCSLLEFLTQKARVQVLDPASAYQMTSLLIGSAKRGTARNFGRCFRQVVGGKTGTTSNNNDTWFVGFSPDIVVGSYVGYDIPRSLGDKAVGASVAMPIVSNFMQKVLKDKQGIQFKIPSNIMLRKVNILTGEVDNASEAIVEAMKIAHNDNKRLGDNGKSNVINIEAIEENALQDITDKQAQPLTKNKEGRDSNNQEKEAEESEDLSEEELEELESLDEESGN